MSNAAISPALARVPRMARARLPGMMCSRTNASTVTPSTDDHGLGDAPELYPIMRSPASVIGRGSDFVKYHSSGLMKP